MTYLGRLINKVNYIFDVIEKARRLIDDETQFSSIFQRTVMGR